jgi:hypothetical protein
VILRAWTTDSVNLDTKADPVSLNRILGSSNLDVISFSRHSATSVAFLVWVRKDDSSYKSINKDQKIFIFLARRDLSEV